MALERSSRPLTICSRCLRNTILPHSSLRSLTTTPHLNQETIEPGDGAANTHPPPPPLETHKPITPPSTRANIVHTNRSEQRLFKEHNVSPVGSRRRRAAIATSTGIPFQQLPYQCFQEARKVLLQDRKEKVEGVGRQREKIERLKVQRVEGNDVAKKEHRLRSMERRLEELKILADINDPVVKKTFEDGLGDMTKPIYRHLSDLQWRSYKRQVLMQRITQMNVIPDVLPAIDPIVSTSLSFGRKNVQHGDIVPSLTTEQAPTLNIQPYDKGDRLVTIAIVNPDVPDVEKDGFGYRCHFLASNIRISPTETFVRLPQLDDQNQVVLPWLPAFSQKGLPYQRMSVFVLEQPEGEGDVGLATVDTAQQNAAATQDISADQQAEAAADAVSESSGTTAQPDTQAVSQSGQAIPAAQQAEGAEDAVSESSGTTISAGASAAMQGPTDPTITRSHTLPVPHIKQRGRYTKRSGFKLLSYATKFRLKAVGVDLFRTVWDEGTAGVMRRVAAAEANRGGKEVVVADGAWDVEFKRKRVEPLPYKRLKAERYR